MLVIRGPARRRGLKAEINVTPLVDVVLVLLIVFMVFTPWMANDKEVELPWARAGSDAEQGSSTRTPFVIALTADKRLWLGMNETQTDALVRQARQRLKAQPGLQILLKADKQLTIADVRPLLAQLKDAGAHRVDFAVATSPSRH